MGHFSRVGQVPTGDGPKTKRLAFRGGCCTNGASVGLFALGLDVTRARRTKFRGFRPAFALCCRSLTTTVMRTKQGKRGPFPPRCKTGKSQQPRVASRQRKRRGANSKRWLYVNWEQPTEMERLAFRGGNYNNGASDGLFALNLNETRTNRNRNRGFRPALIPRRQKPHDYGYGAGTGIKGGCFRLVAKRENYSVPTWQVDDESGVGTFRDSRYAQNS